MTPSPEFREILWSVRNNAMRSRISWDIWWAQEGEDERPKHLESMNRYSEFFCFDAHAHLTAFVAGAYRLYDKRNDVRSIRTLISKAKSDSLDSRSIQRSQSLLDAAEPIEAKLSVLRNKAFGHTDLSKTYDEVFEAAQITPFQLRDLLTTALQIVNTFESTIGDPVTEFNDYPVADLRSLLRFPPRSSRIGSRVGREMGCQRSGHWSRLALWPSLTV